MRKGILIVFLTAGLAMTAAKSEGMLIDDAKENNIPGDCQAVAHVLVQLAKSKATSTPEQLLQLAEKLLKGKKYQGSFGTTDFVAPFYVGMTLQSPPETDKFMATVTETQLAEMEEEEEIHCVKESLIELHSRTPAEDAPTSPHPAQTGTAPAAAATSPAKQP